ncbi:asparagine synthase-related protein [Streptomyces noursei]|uniref:asparagine synthase-related protein n=1 Tax=Streptomyces noursei TaxID=1971 RepID=UPI0036D37931
MYWTPDKHGFWWATRATPLAALVGSSPDLPLLLAELSLSGVDVRHTDGPYNGVRRVPPGHALVVDDGSYEAKVTSLHRPGTRNLLDGTDAVRDAVTAAVTRRAKSWERISTDLSGGIDSGCVTSVAASTRPLMAVTYTDTHMRGCDDVPYARRLAAAVGGIAHELVDGSTADVRHFDGLADPDQLPSTDTPSLATALLAIKGAQLAPAVAYGSQAHLTGRGGDNVLDAVNTRLVDQYLAGDRRTAFLRTTDYARSRLTAPWRMWWQLCNTAKQSYPNALERLAHGISAGISEPRSGPTGPQLLWCSPTRAARWLTPTGRALVTELISTRSRAATGQITPAVLHERLALEWMANSHAQFAEIARQRWNLAVHAPLLDTTVVDACLSIPSYERVRPGTYKPLAQAAFTGLVPQWLLGRGTKTDFTTSLYEGLARNASTLRQILKSSLLAEAGLLDQQRILADLDRAVAGADAPLAHLHTLVVTELWVRRLPTNYATWWQTEEVPAWR